MCIKRIIPLTSIQHVGVSIHTPIKLKLASGPPADISAAQLHSAREKQNKQEHKYGPLDFYVTAEDLRRPAAMAILGYPGIGLQGRRELLGKANKD
jgi:hypothetical protein